MGITALAASGQAGSSEASGHNKNAGKLDALVDSAHDLLKRLQSPTLISFLDAWPKGLHRRIVVPSSVPVLRWLPDIDSAAPQFSALFVSALAAAAPLLAWRRSYTAAAVGATFYENYGWTELVGLTGPRGSDHLACGVLLLGPQAFYPRHRHEAEEIYVPLVGTASWQGGDAHWSEQPPASVIHHASHEPHAMRTGASPLLALYLWRSANLAQKSQLDPERTA